ncbi:MAG: hypothetical protein Q8Q90_02030 [bacterium]|nr:hypothetical protein [bacterium]
MKEKLKYLVQKIKQRHPRTLTLLSALVLSVIVTIFILFSFINKAEVTKADSEETIAPYNPLNDTSIVGVVDADDNKLNNSWPGEIISSEVSQIQPQREGVIIDWKVRIGDTVSAGKVLGKISAAPATPELIKMLAEQAEAANRSKAQAIIADEFSSKEKKRLDALKNALSGNNTSSSDLSFMALDGMRKKVASQKSTVRSFIERTLSSHVSVLTNFTDWRYLRFGGLNPQYGIYSPNTQSAYEIALLKLADKLKNSTDLPIEAAENYFLLVIQLANNSSNSAENSAINEFKLSAIEDQKEFLDMLSDYRMIQAELDDKETEYKIMVNEGGSMVEKDRLMAHAEADAAEVAYNTVAKEINGGSYIISPRAGTVSAIYRKIGDLVDPTMPIAVISGFNDSNLIVRMNIPNNIVKPKKGDEISVVRPGFPRDIYKAKILGVGTTLNESGSYMADAVLIDKVNWPAGASVRVIAPEDSSTPVIKLSSILWNEEGLPYMFGISEGGRIFIKKITIGRTLGTSVEIYSGIKNGDRYLISPTPDIKENMLLEDILPKESNVDPSDKKDKESMGGMEM